MKGTKINIKVKKSFRMKIAILRTVIWIWFIILLLLALGVIQIIQAHKEIAQIASGWFMLATFGTLILTNVLQDSLLWSGGEQSASSRAFYTGMSYCVLKDDIPYEEFEYQIHRIYAVELGFYESPLMVLLFPKYFGNKFLSGKPIKKTKKPILDRISQALA